MPVSGLVVTLCEEPQLRAAVFEAIGRDPRITVGVLEANRQAIVLDTASSDEDGQLWDWLNTLPGVMFVEVAFVGFEEQGKTMLTQAEEIPTAKR